MTKDPTFMLSESQKERSSRMGRASDETRQTDSRSGEKAKQDKPEKIHSKAH